MHLQQEEGVSIRPGSPPVALLWHRHSPLARDHQHLSLRQSSCADCWPEQQGLQRPCFITGEISSTRVLWLACYFSRLLVNFMIQMI